MLDTNKILKDNILELTHPSYEWLTHKIKVAIEQAYEQGKQDAPKKNKWLELIIFFMIFFILGIGFYDLFYHPNTMQKLWKAQDKSDSTWDAKFAYATKYSDSTFDKAKIKVHHHIDSIYTAGYKKGCIRGYNDAIRDNIQDQQIINIPRTALADTGILMSLGGGQYIIRVFDKKESDEKLEIIKQLQRLNASTISTTIMSIPDTNKTSIKSKKAQ